MFNNECSFRDFLDGLDSDNLFINEGFDDEEISCIKDNVDIIKSKAENTVCFSIGDATNVATIKPIFELIKPPYPQCWFDFYVSDYQRKKYGVFSETVNESLILACFYFNPVINGWCYISTLKLIRGDDKNIAWQPFGHGDDKDLHLIGAMIVSRFLSALNCANIIKKITTPPKAIQKQRSKRGKKPLFSYYTLHVDLPKTKTTSHDLGGTHSSPRIHLRRGHPRQYSQNKWTWVQPCVVGNKQNGLIHKDYSAKFH